MYSFILNQWIMRKVDEVFVEAQHQRGRITKEERDMILASAQLPH